MPLIKGFLYKSFPFEDLRIHIIKHKLSQLVIYKKCSFCPCSEKSMFPIFSSPFLKFIFNIFLLVYFERERESTSRGGAESKTNRIPSRLQTVSAEPNVGLELKNCEIMTSWAEIKSQSLNWLHHPGTPFHLIYTVED